MAADENGDPQISVVIPTRNRGDSILGAIHSVLACDFPDCELLVVDQSTNDETANALAPLLADKRLRYIRTTTVGAGRARNIGLRAAQGGIVAMTDDDCTVAQDWLCALQEMFAANPQVAMVFSSVAAAEHDAGQGTIPNHVYAENRVIGSLADYRGEIGMGAGMSMRREVSLSLGGFDEQLGPGSRFLSAEDHDLALRFLTQAWSIGQSSRAMVIHDGYRTFAQFRDLTQRDWIALGAVHGKFLRAGHWRILHLVGYNALVRGLWEPGARIFAGKRPQGFRRFIFYWQGIARGLRAPVNAATLLFQD